MANTTSKQIRTGMLAYGMSGKIFHGPFLFAHDGFELYGVVERNTQKAGADYPAIKSFGSITDMLADPSIELIVVNTPNGMHFEHAKMAMEMGKHVLVEKPVCTSVQELDMLYKVADRTGKALLFYQNRRWDSDYLNCAEMIDTGLLGKLHEVHFRYDRYKLAIGPKVFKETVQPGSGLQFDLGPHLLDQAIRLFGRPQKIYKRLLKIRPETLVDDFFNIHLSYEDNLEVFLTSSLATQGNPPAFTVYGQSGSYRKLRTDVQEGQLLKGMKVLDPNYGKVPADQGGEYILAKEGGEKKILPEAPSNYLKLFDAVYGAIRENKPFPVTREQIRIQLEILTAPAD